MKCSSNAAVFTTLVTVITVHSQLLTVIHNVYNYMYVEFDETEF